MTAPMTISLAVQGVHAVRIESFGHLHGIPGTFDLALDLRDFIRDPHVSPELRNSTGQTLQVRANVLGAPGAQQLVTNLAAAVEALLASVPPQRPVRVGLSCQGGRHRSVAVAEAAAEQLRLAGHGVLVIHHHITQPVRRAS